MPAQVIGNQATAVELYVAFAGLAPSNAVYQNWLTTANSTSGIQLALQVGQSYANVSDATLAASVLANMGISAATTNQAAFDSLSAALLQVFAAYPGAQRAVVVYNMVNLLSGLEGNATYGAAATAWNNTTLNAFTYASNTANTAPGPINPTPAPTIFTLTTGVDNFTGGSGTDNFIADNTASTVTSAADAINGGAGTDTLTVYGSLDSTPQISNIENVVLSNFADTKNANLGAISGIINVTLANALGASAVTVNNGTAVTLAKNADAAKALTVNYGATDTSASLTLNGVTGNTGVALNVTGTKVATLNLATTGAKSSIGTLNGDAALTKVVVTGDKDLTITDALEVTVATVDASAFTGKLSVKTTNNAGTQDATATGGTVDLTDVTILGGSGNDTIDVSANAADNEVSVNAGAGDDKVVIKASTAYSAATATNAGDSIVGGDGTDTLSVAGDLAASDLSGAISGFEVLEFTASAAGTDMSVNKLGITQFRSTGANVDMVLTGLANGVTATLADDGNDLTATIGTDTSSDVLNVVLESTGTVTGSAIIATNYETLNIVSTKLSTDAATAANKLATVSASSATMVTIGGSTNLIGGTITAKAGATIDASAFSGDLTATTFGASVKSYLGGSGKDQITLAAGDLKQGNTFAGGAGADTLSVTAGANQDMGIVGLSGFETVNLTSNAASTDTVVGDFRNVTDLATLKIVGGDTTDNFTLNRVSPDTTVSFGSSLGNVVTTLNSGTSQKVAFSGNYTVGSLTLDSGTTSLSVTSDDGNATADQAGGVFTSLSGTSLTSITVLGNDQTNLGTLSSTVNSVDASAAKGGLTVTASATATKIVGSQAADSITGGAGNDTIQGGKGGDTISGGAGHDTIVFEATGALNGNDSLTVTFGSGASSDVLNFKNFLSGGSVDQNGGTGTAITAYASSATTDVDIANHVVVLTDATGGGAVTAVDTAAEIAALIQGTGNVFSLTAGGKAVVIAGESTGTNAHSYVYMVNDALDGVSGTVSATDVVLVGTLQANIDIDTLLASNFAFA